MKCLVTGGAGFIGSHLCESLLKKGYFVYCLDNLLTGSEENIRYLKKNKKFKFLKFDVTSPIPTTIKIDYIYHLASPASPLWYQKYPVKTLMTNSLGTYRLLKKAKELQAKFLFTSSSEVYGDPEKHPQEESYWGNVNPVGPRSCYDEGKRFGEALTFAFVKKEKVDARVVRIFNTFGPRMREDDGRVISNFICQALFQKPLTIYGDGQKTRSFCYISDMVEGLILALEKKNTFGEVINLGSPVEKTILWVAKKIVELTNSSSKIIFLDSKPDDPQRRKPVIKKAKKILSWFPKVSFEAGLKKTIDFFKNKYQF